MELGKFKGLNITWSERDGMTSNYPASPPPKFLCGNHGDQQPFSPGLINTALKSLLVKPRIGFLLCLFFFFF